MKQRTIKEQKFIIRNADYCEKRMKYFLRKARVAEWFAASRNMNLDHEALIKDAIRYRRKADWYHARFVIGSDDSLEDYYVVELDLTKSRLKAIAANFYGDIENSDAVKYASRFIESLFNVTIPIDWK